MCLAIPGKVLSIREREGVRMADVQFGGVRREVSSPSALDQLSRASASISRLALRLSDTAPRSP
jgi:hydrogenase maturation factor